MSETVFFPQTEIATPRLRLRRLQPRDAALIALYVGDERVARMLTVVPHPAPPGLAEGFVQRSMAAGPGDEMVWAIDTGDDDENGLIGVITLRPRAPDEAGIAYWLGHAFWGAGYAGEAVEAVAAWAAARGFLALTAYTFQDNLASVKVLTRAGFAYEGEGEVHSVARGGMVPTFLYRRQLGTAG